MFSCSSRKVFDLKSFDVLLQIDPRRVRRLYWKGSRWAHPLLIISELWLGPLSSRVIKFRDLLWFSGFVNFGAKLKTENF